MAKKLLQKINLISFPQKTIAESLNYPRLQLHIQAHQGFIDKLNSFEIDAEKISLGTQDQMIYDLMEYLKEWLQIHILDCDRKVIRFINGENITVDM